MRHMSVLSVAALGFTAFLTARQEGTVVMGSSWMPRRPMHLRTPMDRFRAGVTSYDQAVGLWGLEGGPSIGQILPGLNIGGSLQPHASGRQGNCDRRVHQRARDTSRGVFLPARPDRNRGSWSLLARRHSDGWLRERPCSLQSRRARPSGHRRARLQPPHTVRRCDE